MEKKMEPTLEETLIIATTAHFGQKDKGGAPYILHPIRVMLQQRDETAMKVALLHDVVEDTNITLENLKMKGYSHAVLDAVDHLTKKQREDYEAFILRASENEISRAVKIADLKDNMDLNRIARKEERDYIRIEKYKKALLFLEINVLMRNEEQR